MMNNTYKVNVNHTINVTSQDINDIMCSALEGGICYWANKAEVVGKYLGEWAHEQISRGGSLILHDAESDDKWELNRENLLNGIAKAYEDNWFTDYGWCDGKTIDTCQVDAEVADTIIQLALFGKVVFG